MGVDTMTWLAGRHFRRHVFDEPRPLIFHGDGPPCRAGRLGKIASGGTPSDQREHHDTIRSTRDGWLPAKSAVGIEPQE